jgi:4-hydroxy-3-polyprenylbenzoate decarboxylase
MLKQGKGNRPLKLVVGISGASGSIYGIRLLQKLKQNKVETHLVITKWGQQTIREETDYTIEKVKSLASFYYDEGEQGAAISSGSFKIKGMIIAPCSMKTLSGIANGYADNLIIRAADVTIKEKRKLILVTRETPLNAIHLENMLKLARLGVTIMPPVPAFYTRPRNVDDIVDSTVDRILDQFEIEDDSIKRWNGMQIV